MIWLRGYFSQSFSQFGKALDQTLEMATSAMKNDQGIVGVPTGLVDLDERLGGLHKSDLVIIAGRPSMGKTFGNKYNFHAAKKNSDENKKSVVAFFIRNVIRTIINKNSFRTVKN